MVVVWCCVVVLLMAVVRSVATARLDGVCISVRVETRHDAGDGSVIVVVCVGVGVCVGVWVCVCVCVYVVSRHATPRYARYCPDVDRNVLYASVADHDHWFDTWPGMTHLPRMPSYEEASPRHRPLKITFGDDSDLTQDELRQFVEVRKRGRPLRL